MASPEVNVRIRAKDEATPVLQLIKGRLSEVEPAGVRASRGVEKVADGLRGLGREAIGVNRDVSNLLSGLLMFESGGLVAAGAIAGLGAVALAFEFLTRKTREEQEANDKVVDSLAATAEQGNTTAHAIRNMDAAVSSLALHQSQLFELKNPTAAAGLFAGFGPGAAGGLGAALPFIARLIGLTEKEEEAVKRAGVATGQAGKGYVTSTMQASAEAVKFGHASDFVRRQLEAYLRTLRATAADESKTTDERNAAAKELDSLTSAMGKTVAKGQTLAQSLAEQVNYYGQLAQLHPLTSQQLDELSGVLNAVTAAEQDANTSRKDAIALLGAERQALALLGGEAAKQAEKDLRASVGRSPFTAPQRPADGRSLTPFAVPDGLIDTRSIISPSLVQGLEAGMDETIRSLDKTLAQAAREAQFTQIQQGFAQSISQSITDGITAGFDTAIASGDIGAGFGALIGTLLSGIGTAMEQFGAAALVASQFMQAIMKALMALDPSGAAAAAIGMIAMGAVFKALGNAASSAFGGGGGTGGGGVGGVGGVRGRDQAETTRIIVQTPASAHATPATQMRPLHFTVIGTDSAKAQREIKELLRNADARAA
jgi:hypothetical protein